MELEEALVTAIAYEKKIRDVYREAAGTVADPVGRGILRPWGTMSRDTWTISTSGSTGGGETAGSSLRNWKVPSRPEG